MRNNIEEKKPNSKSYSSHCFGQNSPLLLESLLAQSTAQVCSGPLKKLLSANSAIQLMGNGVMLLKSLSLIESQFRVLTTPNGHPSDGNIENKKNEDSSDHVLTMIDAMKTIS